MDAREAAPRSEPRPARGPEAVRRATWSGLAAFMYVLVAASCGGGGTLRNDPDYMATPANQAAARQLMVDYAMEVLVGMDMGAEQAGEAAVEFRGVTYAVDVTGDLAALDRQIFFEMGNSALQNIDALGVDPFEVWPLCSVAIPWMMEQIELSMIGMEGDPLDTLAAADVLTDATRDLIEAVGAELATVDDPGRLPPAERLDPAGCAQAEADERERRGWPPLQ